MSKTVRRSGFTLPEILVTVTIIAVLAAAVVPAVTQYVNKGNTPASQQDVEQFRNAVTAFTADTRHYPGDLVQLIRVITVADHDGAATPALFTAVDIAKWKGPYTAAAITNPGGLYTSSGLGFTFGSTISLVNSWLQVPITVPTMTAADCPAILALDKALDGPPAIAGQENSTGIITWTNGGPACTAATVGSAAPVTLLSLRLVPAT
jgi:prepilin-type N-terminal cleavage/methylation domain-containing protein